MGTIQHANKAVQAAIDDVRKAMDQLPITGVRYTADSLLDVAKMFEVRAELEDELMLRPHTGTGKAVITARARVWREAAAILRRTTIKVQA